METAGPGLPAAGAAPLPPPPPPAQRKGPGRAPLQDLSARQPEPVQSSSLTPLFRRLRLKDGRSTLPDSRTKPAIKIWADSLPSMKLDPKNTLEEKEAWPDTEEQQLGLVPDLSSVPKAAEGADSPHQMGQGESAPPAISPRGAESGEEPALGVVVTPQDSFGRWRADAADTPRSDREVEKDDADGPCAPDTPHPSDVTARMAAHRTAPAPAENGTSAANEPCLDSDPADARAVQGTAAEPEGQETESLTAAAAVSAVPSVCSPERLGLSLAGSADGEDPEEASVTQVLESPSPSEESRGWALTPEAGSLQPPSSLHALKETEGNSSALPIPEGAGYCPLSFGGDQPSWLVPEEVSFQASVLKDVASSSAEKPSLQGGAAVTTPVPSAESGCSVARTLSWMTPLEWLEKNVRPSAVLESLRQSLPLPALQQDAGTSVTPVSAFSAGTWMTPQALLEKSMNTSGEWPVCAKDSAAETDSLLWHCSREHLSALSRAELEGRLESTLIIIEALSCQLRDWQQSQWPVPRLGPADQRDVLTQTDIIHPKAEEQLYHDLYVESRERLQALQRPRESEQALTQELEQARQEMRSCTVESRSFLDLANASLQHLQEDRRTLSREQHQMRALLSRNRVSMDKVAAKLRSCLEERDEMRRQAAKALKAKEAADLVLEAFRVHASARIRALEQGLESQGELCTLIEEAREHQRSWTGESRSFLDSANTSLQNCREDRKTLNQQQHQMRALLSRNRVSMDKVAAKLRSCLEERDEMRRQAAKALKAKEAASRELEVVSRRLEEVTAELQDSVAQVDQLTVANSRLGADLSALLRDLASLERERDELQKKLADLSQETARLRREKELLQQEQAGVRQELREMTECREFIDQENRVSCEQLMETENKLKSTLAVLRERSMQYEDLKDAYQHLQRERDALCEELRCGKVEALGLQLNRSKILTSSLELTQSKERLLDLVANLRAALQGEAADAVPRSRACTPRSDPASFVGSVLKALAGKGVAEEAAGGCSAFTKVEPAAAPKTAEIEESLLEAALELKSAVTQLVAVSCQTQEAACREIQELQDKIAAQQHRLESLESQLQDEIDARDANITKLNKVLRVRFETEKELQDIVRQQEEKMLQFIDQSGEVTSLKAEVSHLKHLLQRAETEAEVLWEEMRGQQPGVRTLDAGAVQEKVWLRQEVNKLRELLLGKDHEYQDHRRILEGKLHYSQKMLRSCEETQEKVKEALSSIPAGVAASSKELQSLLGYLGLKLADGNGCSGDAL